jgi:surface polysaccharide O-acyltransferase-like enzyme
MTTETIAAGSARAAAARTRVEPAVRARLAFVDNLRIGLVTLVVVHHLAVTYGGDGSWYVYEGGADTITTAVLTLFVAVNQAFFMGLYFSIAAYFTPGSLDAKGSKLFLRDRLLRLGVPLVFWMLVVDPLLAYGLGITVWGVEGSVWEYLADYWRGYVGLNTGPLWFLEALLLFSLVYVLGRRLVRPRHAPGRPEGEVPGDGAIAVAALAVGLVTFGVRIWLPVGWTFAPLNFQLPHFPQYIAMFALGILAYRRGWLDGLPDARGRRWGWVVVFLLVVAPILFVVGGALDGNTDPFRGGLHWQAVTYAVWEQFLCVGLVISLLVWFRRRYDRQGRLAKALAANAYAVYVIHAPVVVFAAVALRDVQAHPFLKFAWTGLLCVPACFLIAEGIRRLPGARRVL